MMRIRPEPIESEEEAAFAEAADQEVTFLLMPMATYRECSDRAKIEGCTAAEIVAKALSQYLRPGKDVAGDSPTKIEPSAEPRPEPDIVMKSRRKR